MTFDAIHDLLTDLRDSADIEIIEDAVATPAHETPTPDNTPTENE